MNLAWRYKADIWIGSGLLAFCAFAAWRTLHIKQVTSPALAGPSFMPWVMIVAVSILSICLMGRGGQRLRAEASSDQIVRADWSALMKIGAFVVLLVAYAAAFYSVGYIPSTLVTFVIGLWLIGERKIWVLVVFPVVMTLAVYFGFTELLSVWLP